MTLMSVRECETVYSYLEMPLWCDIVFLGGGYGIAYILIGGSRKCRHIADRGGEGVKKGPKTAYILKERPLMLSAIEFFTNTFPPSRGFSEKKCGFDLESYL